MIEQLKHRVLKRFDTVHIPPDSFIEREATRLRNNRRQSDSDFWRKAIKMIDESSFPIEVIPKIDEIEVQSGVFDPIQEVEQQRVLIVDFSDLPRIPTPLKSITVQRWRTFHI